MIEIQAVALLNNSEEWTDDVYSLSASVMDGVSMVYFMFTELRHDVTRLMRALVSS